MHASATKERFIGCILGLALGDALGAPFEGSRSVDARALECLLNDPPDVLHYTDDTEMAVALTETLIEGFTQDRLARNFAHNFDITRGYGRGTIALIRLLRQGASWQEANRSVFPDGSFGNGSAMRIAPLGLMYHDEPDTLKQAAHDSSIVTHAHPLALEGATLVAATTAMALKGASPNEIITNLLLLAELPEYRRSLGLIREFVSERASPGRPSPQQAARSLGVSVAAHESVPAALLAYLLHQEDYAGTLRYAILMGGDTDTIAAMAGAISGARAGVGALPAGPLAKLENRQMLENLASRLYDRAADRR